MGTPYTFEGRIPLKQAIPLGLQHVMAMFVGNLTPLLIIMGACGLTADAGYGALRTALLQNAMTVAGIVTLVQMFSIGPIGGKVPIVMGTSSGYSLHCLPPWYGSYSHCPAWFPRHALPSRSLSDNIWNIQPHWCPI